LVKRVRIVFEETIADPGEEQDHHNAVEDGVGHHRRADPTQPIGRGAKRDTHRREHKRQPDVADASDRVNVRDSKHHTLEHDRSDHRHF
jgi:hypothetical protein